MVILTDDFKLANIHSFTKILVIDGLKFVTKSISKALSDYGYFVFTSIEKNLAIEKIEDYSPDIVIVGQRIGEFSGLEFVQELRKMKQGIKIKVIYIVTMNNDKEIKGLESLGVKYFISKPQNIHQIIKAIEDQ